MYVNDLVHSLCDRISVSAFTDDLAVLCSDGRVSVCNEKLQNACSIVKDWCKEWMCLAENKCSVTLSALQVQLMGSR